MASATSVLSSGDTLDILRPYLPDASVDLVSLEPPFNSTATTTSASATSSARPALSSCATLVFEASSRVDHLGHLHDTVELEAGAGVRLNDGLEVWGLEYR